jgi:sodium bicarbonate transporter 10
VLALVFVRKLMDFLFTKRELSWLDDLMPESKKKKLEDAEKEVSQSKINILERRKAHGNNSFLKN